MKRFESFMADKLEQYVAYRQGLGYAKKGIRPSLSAFDRYLKQQGADWHSLQPSFFLELRKKINKESRTVNTILSGLRSFFQYLVRQGFYTENPLQDIPPLAERYFVPFVFSPEQTEQLLAAACKGIRKSTRYFLTETLH
jgi:site-specific recombinase XerD